MTTTQNLTPAAKRDLAKLQAGQPVQFRYGPLRQLVAAGLVTEDGQLVTTPNLGWDWDSDSEQGQAARRARYSR